MTTTVKTAAKRYEPAIHNVRYGIKGILLYLLPLPSLITAIGSLMRGDVMDTLVTGGIFAAFMVGASVARRGFRLQGEYERRKIARAPSTPFKTVAALIISIATGALDWWSSSLPSAAYYPLFWSGRQLSSALHSTTGWIRVRTRQAIFPSA